ncbi:WD-repeat protein [Auriculariales sp. MPI-PUGE-AT-0066]|nr:WD-repeat protein [Auriculariales sp. MPI-PUGE-AT-0066]
MATLLPPPKRQKLYHGVEAPVPEPPKPTSNIIVQFVSEDDGTSLAPAVTLPANFNRANLEALVNKLSSRDDDPAPFAFHVALKETVEGAPTRIAIANSLEQDVLDHPSKQFTTEDIFVVQCSPQAVFRVRPATRCSSTLSGHSAAILCAAFSPTGGMLATGSGDNNARLWDLHTETPSHVLKGHTGWVLAVEWEARERILATGGHDGHVRLWDPKTGKPLGDAMKRHSKFVTSLSWEPIHINPTNPRLASASKDGTVCVWNAAQRSHIYTLGGHTATVNVVRWGGARNGVLYTASSDRTSGRPLHTLKEHAHWVTTLTLNTDFVLRTGPFDHKGKVPESDEEAQAVALARYKKLVDANGEILITGSDDHTLFLWDVFGTSGTKPKARLTGHQRQVLHVVERSADRSVRLWDGRTGKFIATLRGHVADVYRLTWSADSRLLVSASRDSTVKIWDLKTYKIHTDLPGHTDEVYCVDFVADKIVSGGHRQSNSHCLRIWTYILTEYTR